MESALIISPSNRSASSIASADFPDAVGPAIMTTFTLLEVSPIKPHLHQSIHIYFPDRWNKETIIPQISHLHSGFSNHFSQSYNCNLRRAVESHRNPNNP